MSLTTIAWTAIYGLLATASFANPLFGMLGYMHEYYNRPELRWWGDELPALRWNLMMSLAWGASLLLRQSSLRSMVATSNRALQSLLVLFAIMLVVSAVFAVNSAVSFSWAIQWSKLAIIFPLLVIATIRTRSAFDLFAAAHIAGGLSWGWEAWVDPKREAGRLYGIGSGDTLDDNSAAAHLLTILPFIGVYLFTHKDKRLRLLALVAAPFVINTLILCNSRGSMVGLLAALLSAIVLVRGGQRLRLAGVGVAAVAVLLVFADPQFIARQRTTTNYEEDGSAQGRIESWVAGTRLVRDRPFGAGGRGFHLLSDRYIPEIVAAHGGDLRAPHNTWVMVSSEWGVAGFSAYLTFLGSVFLMLRRVKLQSDGHDFYFWRAIAIQVALIGFLVASTFSDRLYAEVGYWLFGLAFSLYRIQRTELAELETQRASDTSRPRLHRVEASSSAA